MAILIIDDDPVALKLVGKILVKKEHEILEADSAASGRHILESGKQVDLIICDIMMPGEDGFDVLAYLRANLRFGEIPIIMCTGLSDTDAVIRARRLGARDYIVKPIDAGTLLEKVGSILAKGRGTVMVVDDETAIRDLIARTVEWAGYHAVTASEGKPALSILAERHIDVIISDIVMPGMTGLDLLVEVKANYPDIPVIMITGQSAEFRAEELIAAGADEYIAKPFKNIEILNKIRRLINPSRAV